MLNKTLLLAIVFGIASAYEWDCDIYNDPDCNPELPGRKTHAKLWYWRWFGAMSWLRAFDMWQFFVYMPMAIAWTRLNRGNASRKSAFDFLSSWKWGGIAGWIAAILNIAIGVTTITNNSLWNETKKWKQHERIELGVSIIVAEVIGQALYYFFRNGARMYARDELLDNQEFDDYDEVDSMML